MTRIVPLIALVLSGAAVGLSLFRGSTPAPVAVSEVRPPRSDEELASLERRIEMLEETSSDLERRLSELKRKPTAALDGGAELTAEVEQLRAEVRGMIAGEALNSEGGKAYLKDAVR